MTMIDDDDDDDDDDSPLQMSRTKSPPQSSSL